MVTVFIPEGVSETIHPKLIKNSAAWSGEAAIASSALRTDILAAASIRINPPTNPINKNVLLLVILLCIVSQILLVFWHY